ncbi:MAG: hypothetical protein HN742_20190 [Lentisphaerae bacterium]|nr:hypothetical protein [Lentisphaerota bacterium]MBT5604935.1 hypothetical protein [Lentisphaerota bacterium]MBT7054529.1 hypothetical protein [Lentisphaerota bacterium]MBT7844212.1 hypothetical protein [Lentisphaerota bacterium]
MKNSFGNVPSVLAAGLTVVLLALPGIASAEPAQAAAGPAVLRQSVVWHFNEGSGIEAKAEGESGSALKLIRTKSSPLWSPGVEGKALNCMGSGMAVGQIPSFLAIDGDFTIDLFLKLTKPPVGAYGGIFELMRYQESGFRIMTGKGGDIFWTVQAPNEAVGQFRIRGPKLAFGTWRHLAFVKEGSQLTIFLDNEKVTDQELPGTIKGGPERIVLGYTGGPKYYLNGILDGLRLANYPRTDFSREKAMVGEVNAEAAKASALEAEKRQPRRAVSLVNNGDFESGAALWNFKLFLRDIPYDAVWAVDEQEKSSGTRSLRLEKTLGMSLAPQILDVTPGETYTFAADLKSDAPGATVNLHAYCDRDGWSKAKVRRSIKMSTEWARYAVTFRVPKDYTNRLTCALFFNSANPTIWLDRVTVCPGTAREPEGPSVPFGLTSEKPGNTFFVGEDVVFHINLAPGGGDPGGKIQILLLDAWGQTTWAQDVPPRSQVVTLPGAQGLYCVRAVYRDATGQIRNEASVRLTVIPPGPASRFFGMQYSYGFFPRQVFEEATQRRWSWGAKTGRYNVISVAEMLEFDAQSPALHLLKMSHRRGIELYACLCARRTRQGGHAYDMNHSARGVVTPEDLEDWAQGLRNFLRHAGPYLTCVEIFNEPNCWKDPEGRPLHGRDYVKALKLSFEICREMFPELKVLGPSITGIPKARMKFVEDVLEAGGGDCMDGLSFHPYGAREDDVYLQVKYLRDLVERHHPGLPLYCTEVGMPSYQNRQYHLYAGGSSIVQSVNPFLTAEVSEGERVQARRLMKNAVACKSLDVEFFTHHTDGCTAWGTCQDLTGTPTFVGAAYIFMNRLLHEAKPRGPLAISDALRAFHFEKPDGSSVAVLWAAEADIDCRLRLDARAEEFEIFDLSGRQTALPDSGQTVVELDHSPVYLVAKTMSPVEFRALLEGGRIIGIKNPLLVDLRVLGPQKVIVDMRNRLSIPIAVAGQATIEAGGETIGLPVNVAELAPGDSHPRVVAFKQKIASGMVDFEFRGKLNGEAELAMSQTLNVVFCHPVAEIKIDGDLTDWAKVPSLEMGADRLIVLSPDRGCSGPGDHQARIWLGYDRDNLYVAAEVTDDIHTQNGREGISWRGDGIQFFLDPLGDSASGVIGEGDDYRFTLCLANGASNANVTRDRTASFELSALRGTGEIPERMIARSVKRAEGRTRYEIRFPKEQIAPLAPGPGVPFRFSVIINDNDQAMDGDTMKKRDSGLSLTGPGTQPYAHPELYSDVVFIE